MSITAENEQVEIRRAVLDIDDAANSVKEASNSLRISYIFDNENESFTSIRADIYRKAMLYKDGVAPFSESTFSNVGIVCNEILRTKTEEIKLRLGKLIIDSKLNEQLCNYTSILHTEILMEFKKIQDESLRTILKLTLDNSLKRELKVRLFDKDFKLIHLTLIVESLVGGKSGNEQMIEFSKNVLPVLEPLLKSIYYFNDFLTKISGSISILHNQLINLNVWMEGANNDKDNEDILVNLIKSLAKDIYDFCIKYQGKIPDYKSDLDSIADAKPDNSCISTWILEAINKKEEGSHENFKKFVKAKGEQQLIKICG